MTHLCPEKGAYFHPNFLRDEPLHIDKLRRVRAIKKVPAKERRRLEALKKGKQEREALLGNTKEAELAPRRGEVRPLKSDNRRDTLEESTAASTTSSTIKGPSGDTSRNVGSYRNSTSSLSRILDDVEATYFDSFEGPNNNGRNLPTSQCDPPTHPVVKEAGPSGSFRGFAEKALMAAPAGTSLGGLSSWAVPSDPNDKEMEQSIMEMIMNDTMDVTNMLAGPCSSPSSSSSSLEDEFQPLLPLIPLEEGLNKLEQINLAGYELSL